MSESRQLAAILFTDIVGYTALMGEDEHKAFDLLKKNRLLQKPLIEKFNGTWIKELGDGVLALFVSATDAVACACSIVKGSRQVPGLQLRIGIALTQAEPFLDVVPELEKSSKGIAQLLNWKDLIQNLFLLTNSFFSDENEIS